jgi:hypothetical protein
MTLRYGFFTRRERQKRERGMGVLGQAVSLLPPLPSAAQREEQLARATYPTHTHTHTPPPPPPGLPSKGIQTHGARPRGFPLHGARRSSSFPGTGTGQANKPMGMFRPPPGGPRRDEWDDGMRGVERRQNRCDWSRGGADASVRGSGTKGSPVGRPSVVGDNVLSAWLDRCQQTICRCGAVPLGAETRSLPFAAGVPWQVPG